MLTETDLAAGVVLIVFVEPYVAISPEKANGTAAALLGMEVVGIVLWVTCSNSIG
jgi:hypothetical protein